MQSRALFGGWAAGSTFSDGDHAYPSLDAVFVLGTWVTPWAEGAWTFSTPLATGWVDKYRVVHTVRRRAWVREFTCP